MITNHTATTYQISDDAQLSLAIWQDNGDWIGSAIIMRLRPNGWRVDGSTEIACRSSLSNEDAAREDTRFRLADAGMTLVTAELGEWPARFYRDNFINYEVMQ